MRAEAVRLNTPLQDLMDKRDLPASSMEEPTGDEILSESELGKTSNVFPCGISDDKSTSGTPGRTNAVPNTVIGTSARDVGLIQGVIVWDVVKVLWNVSM